MSKRMGMCLPYCDGRNQRIKGASPKIITPRNFGLLVDDLKTLKDHGENPLATRVTVKAVMDRKLREQIGHEVFEGYRVEAAFPIEHVFKGHDLVSIGFNKPERRTTDEEATRNQKILERAKREHSKVDIKELAERNRGRIVEQIECLGDKSAEEILDMFNEIFFEYPVELTVETIKAMGNDHLIFTARTDKKKDSSTDDKIIATFMADKEVITIEGKEVSFFDFVNVTAPGEIALDLVPWMAYQTMLRINMYKNPIVFTEARADSPILQACCVRAGMLHSDTLEQSSIFGIKGVDKQGAVFRDTQVWHIPSKYYDTLHRTPTREEILGLGEKDATSERRIEISAEELEGAE